MIKLLKAYFSLFTLSISGGGGSSGGGTTTQTTKPWEGATSHLRKIYRQAENQYDRKNRPEFFGGQTYADMSGQRSDALDNMAATSYQNMLDTHAGDELSRTLQGDYLSPDSNPYLGQIADRVTRDVKRGVDSQFASAGRDMNSGAYADVYSQNVADALAPIYGNAYQSERENMQRSLALAPQVNQLQYADDQQLASVGNQYEMYNQLGIDEAIQRHNFDENAAASALAQYSSLVNGGHGFGTTTTTQPTYGGNALTGAIGGGLTGYGLASQVSSLNPYTAPLAIGGALLGGLGLFD